MPPPLPQHVPPAIRALVERSLAKDPARRFPSAMAMSAAARQSILGLGPEEASDLQPSHQAGERTGDRLAGGAAGADGLAGADGRGGSPAAGAGIRERPADWQESASAQTGWQGSLAVQTSGWQGSGTSGTTPVPSRGSGRRARLQWAGSPRREEAAE